MKLEISRVEIVGGDIDWIAWCIGVAIIIGIVWLAKWRAEEEIKQKELQEKLKDMSVYHGEGSK